VIQNRNHNFSEYRHLKIPDFKKSIIEIA